MNDPDLTAYKLFPLKALDIDGGFYGGVVDLDGGCQGVDDNNHTCNVLTYSEYNSETNVIYLELVWTSPFDSTKCHTIYALDTVSFTPIHYISGYNSDAPQAMKRMLLAIVLTPMNGTVLYTSIGAYSSTNDKYGMQFYWTI